MMWKATTRPDDPADHPDVREVAAAARTGKSYVGGSRYMDPSRASRNEKPWESLAVTAESATTRGELAASCRQIMKQINTQTTLTRQEYNGLTDVGHRVIKMLEKLEAQR